jgi:hypothetical protein
MAYRLSFDEHKKAIVEKLKLELMDKRTETAQQRKLLRCCALQRPPTGLTLIFFLRSN